MLMPPRCPGMWLHGSPDLLFNSSTGESPSCSTLLRFWYETCRISKVGNPAYVKIKGKYSELWWEEWSEQSRLGESRWSTPSCQMQVYTCSSVWAMLSNSPLMNQAGTKVQISGLIHIIRYLSVIFLFSKINKLHGLKSVVFLIHVKNLWLALFAQFLWSYKLRVLCSSWTPTALFSHLAWQC